MPGKPAGHCCSEGFCLPGLPLAAPISKHAMNNLLKIHALHLSLQALMLRRKGLKPTGAITDTEKTGVWCAGVVRLRLCCGCGCVAAAFAAVLRLRLRLRQTRRAHVKTSLACMPRSL